MAYTLQELSVVTPLVSYFYYPSESLTGTSLLAQTVFSRDAQLATKERKKFAYAHFENPKEVENAIHALNCTQINGTEVALNYANNTNWETDGIPGPASGSSGDCEGSKPASVDGSGGNNAGTTRLHPNYFYTVDLAKISIR
jgi:hypothetical protein